MKDSDDLKQYFPDIDEEKLPERDFIMGILWTLKTDVMKQLINETRERRAITNANDDNMMVEVTEAARDQLLSLLPQKSKHYYIHYFYS